MPLIALYTHIKVIVMYDLHEDDNTIREMVIFGIPILLTKIWDLDT